jgi:hypothetical protein
MAAQDLASRSVFAVNAHGSADAQKRRDKGLGWSDDENLALCLAAAFVSQDSIMGASMRQVQYARRIRGAFIKNLLRPADACSQDGTGCALDRRRWDGRTAVSCGKPWSKVKAACVKLHACVSRIKRMELTRAPTDDDLLRCALALFNLGASVTSCLYDVIRAKSYPVGKEFPFSLSYDFLSEKTVLLECGEDELAICSSGDDGEGAEISSGRDTDVRITGSPPSGSVIGGPHSGARDSAQDDADGFGHGGSTARLARRPLPPGRKAALAGRKRSRGGGDAGVGEVQHRWMLCPLRRSRYLNTLQGERRRGLKGMKHRVVESFCLSASWRCGSSSFFSDLHRPRRSKKSKPREHCCLTR